MKITRISIAVMCTIFGISLMAPLTSEHPGFVIVMLLLVANLLLAFAGK